VTLETGIPEDGASRPYCRNRRSLLVNGYTEVRSPLTLPWAFCWSKFGSEAGEDPSSILRRKEAERQLGDGTFLWGIGNSIGPSLLELLKHVHSPQVIFTPMRCRAAVRDARPPTIVLWQSATGIDGSDYKLPRSARVTSRLPPRGRHFALVCHSRESILGGDGKMWIDHTTLRNLRSGSPVGASQVTSIVKQMESARPERPTYRVAFAATLQYPFLVTLADPVPSHPSLSSFDRKSVSNRS